MHKPMLVRATAFVLIMFCGPLSAQSVCIGTTANGSLIDGVQIPRTGENFVPYSNLAVTVGRTYVHSKVRDIIVDSYKKLETSQPNTVFMYGETGWQSGGKFKPHKTHQNGLSVDFMVPVLEGGVSVPLATSPLNKFGYSIEFDEKGVWKEQEIDFDAMAAHIRAVHETATALGVEIWRVIFDPKLQSYLLDAPDGAYISEHIQLSKKRSWVRHDEHYHIDFIVPCRKSGA